MRHRAFACLLAAAACGGLEETQPFPVEVDGLAQTLAVPGQPVLVLGAGFEGASLKVRVGGQVVTPTVVGSAYLAFPAPAERGRHVVQVEVDAGGEDEEEEPVVETYEAGTVEVIETLAPLAPALEPGRGYEVSWHSYAGDLSGELRPAEGRALVASLDFGPAAPPAGVPFLGELSAPYALVFRATVEGDGAPLPEGDAVLSRVDGVQTTTLGPGAHELEIRLAIENALSSVALQVSPGAATPPGL